jgi:hypothetical protein
MFSIVQDGRHPASSRKRARTRVPYSVCTTSGWNCTPNRPRSGFSTAATGVAAVRAVTRKPGGAAVQVSPCDIHTCCFAGVPDSRRLAPVSSAVAPYSARPVRSTVPPSPATSS